MSADIPIAAQIAEVQRELAMRKRVYGSRVANGQMGKADAELHMGRTEPAAPISSTLERLVRNR